MGFKTDASFLRFLTMGAVGSRHVMRELRNLGFHPVELERYSTSNKIWATKVKRLRLPDILCARTGIRIEVRAKSCLEIRMSHAPSNPDRHWDVGLRDEDVVAIVLCRDTDQASGALPPSSFFNVSDLRRAVDTNQISRLKAASEGSEQHLTWPSVVSSRAGRAIQVVDNRLRVTWSADDRPERQFSYNIAGKSVYVAPGQFFDAETTFLAGTPERLANLSSYLRNGYDPVSYLESVVDVDRYAAAKAIPERPDLHRMASRVLASRIGQESDLRIGLEMARAAAALGVSRGSDYICSVIWGDAEPAMRMEAIFIATELGAIGLREFGKEQLVGVAQDVDRFGGDEARQAAIWGLGHAGLRAYESLIRFVGDAEDNVALHAIAAFGSDSPPDVVAALVEMVRTGSLREAAAASEALRVIASNDVVLQLVQAASERNDRRPWIIAALGRLPESKARPLIGNSALSRELEPLYIHAPGSAWTASAEVEDSLKFLLKQRESIQ